MSASISQPAPDFTAKDQNGKTHTLSDYKGKWLLLYFYPKDDTPGCTKEACAFRDAVPQMPQDIAILGVSADDEESHKAFAEKYSLPFTLLSDTKKIIIQAYGADGIRHNKRSSYLINPMGKVAKIYENIDVASHAKQVLNDILVLRKNHNKI